MIVTYEGTNNQSETSACEIASEGSPTVEPVAPHYMSSHWFVVFFICSLNSKIVTQNACYLILAKLNG